MGEPVAVSVDARVGIIELARSEKFNCLSGRAWELIDEARCRFEGDANVRAVVIRAQGKNFCTGADLDEVKSLSSDLEKVHAFVECGHKALLALEASPLPVIAAVQGPCLAGGIELMLGADVVFAACSARIGDQHAQYGLGTGLGRQPEARARRAGASHVSGLLSRPHDRWPDVLRGSGPDQNFGLETPIDPSRVFPIDGSSVSHHAIITLAIGTRRADAVSTLHRQALQTLTTSAGAR